MPDQNKQSNQSLTEKIAELEALLARNKAAKEHIPVLQETADDDTDAGIPILDELVASGNMEDEWQERESPHATADQMMDLINNIEHRLTDELETLVNTLKSTMKESIINELKTRLETTASPLQQPATSALHRDYQKP